MRRLALAIAVAAPLAAVPANAQISIFNVRNSLVQFALSQISTPGLTITAETVVEGEEGGTELQGLRVADERGVWLEIERVNLRWNARRILLAELDIVELSATGVNVLRQPEPVEVEVVEGSELAEAEADPFSWPRAPIATVVREMRLDRVTIAEGVIAEQSLAFDATGSATDEGDIQAVELTLTRTDSVDGRIALDYERDFAADTLRLNLDASEAAGGLVAELAGFPDDSATRVVLSADGPLTDWQAELTAETDRVFAADGTASFDFEDTIEVRALLGIEPGPEMAPAVAIAMGERARLEIDVAEDTGGVVRIRDALIESPALSLEARGSFTRPTSTVDVGIDMDVSPVMAGLVEGLDFQGLRFDGRASGPLDRLEARGDLVLEGLATEPVDVVSADLATVVTVEGETVGFDVSGGAQGLRLDRIAPETVGPAQIDARGSYAPDGLTLETFSLSSALLTAEARGEVGLGEDGTAALDYRVSAPDLAPVAFAYDTRADGTVEVTGAAAGPLSAPRLTGEARLTDLAFEGESYGQVTLTHDVTLGEDIEGQARIEASGSPVGPAEAEARFALLGSILDLSTLRAEALGATIDGNLVYELDTSLVRGDVNLDAPDLSPLANLSGTPARGSVSGVISAQPVDGRQDATLDLEIRDLEAFEARIASLDLQGRVEDALGAPALNARISARDAGYQDARIAAVDGTVTGTDLVDAPTGEVDLTLSEARGFGASAGSVRVTGTVTDATTLADLEAEIEAAALAYQDATVDRLTATVSGTDVLGGGPVQLDAKAGGAQGFGASVGTLTLDAEATDVTALAEAAATISAETVSVADVRIARIDADAAGTNLLSDAPQGEATVKTGRFSGAAEGTGATLVAKLTGEGRDARLTATLDAPGPLSAQGASVGGIDLDATVADPLGTDPRLDARLDTGAVEAEGVRLDGIDLTAEGLLSALSVALKTEGTADDTEIALDTAAEIDAIAAAPVVRATRLEARYGEEEVALASPLTVEIGDTITAEGLDLTLPGGRLTGDASVFPNGLGADLALAMDDLGLLERLADVPVNSGRLEADVEIDTRPGRARGTVEAQVSELRIENLGEESDALGLALDGTWDGRTAALDAQATGPFGDPLMVDAGVPLRATGGVLPAVPQDGALTGTVTWQGDIDRLWVFVPLPDHVLAGRADVDLELSGTVSAPKVGGSVRLDDGRYEFLETGTILTDLTVTSSLSPDGDLALELNANDGASGTLEVVAEVGSTLDATVRSNRAVLVRRDDVTAAISLDLAAEGPLAGPDISGTVTVDRAEVRLVNALPPSIATLGDVRIKGTPPPEPEEPAGEAIALNVDVRAPRDIFIRGRGLDSEWMMNLAVRGTAARPVVTGAVERVRGRLNFAGTRFDLETGTIRFTGGGSVDPLLDVRLEADKNGIQGGIEVTGNASDPQVGFYSTPALPESEVMPRLLFGKSAQSLSAGQALQIASGLAVLLDGSDGTLGIARDITGLDVIDIDPSGDEAAVTVGKNIGDDVFVGARQPIDGSETEVIVEIEVFPEVLLDAEIDTEGDTSVGVNWQRNF